MRWPHLFNELFSHTTWRTRRARTPRPRKRFVRPRLEALEDRTLLATEVVSPGGVVPGSFSSVQAAVNAANPGDTVLVDPGVYIEQVTIDKSLTLEGNGAGAIIRAPSTMTSDSFGLNVLLEINNAAMMTTAPTVNINNMTIAGPATNINDGILVVGGATANVTDSTIADINQGRGSFGNQTGIGILIGGSASQAVGEVGHATITDCTIRDYQKGGIVIGRNGSTGDITGNTVTGVGPTPLIAQNGIQISPGAGSSTVSNNTVSGNEFTGTGSGSDPFTNTQAAGILDFAGPNSITGNTVVNNDIGIYSTNSVTTGTGTTISGNTVQGSFMGIQIDQGTTTVSNNTITGNNIGVLVAAFASNTIDSQGTLVSNNITNNGNGGLSFPGAGILLQNETGATSTAELTAANFNRIVGNSAGLNNATTIMVDATNNWWGSNAGPGGAVSGPGPVTDNPWLVLEVTASPTTLLPSGVATVVADLTKNSNGMDTSALGHVPDDIPVSFAATLGTISPTASTTAAGKAVATFTATTPGTATVSATVDNQTSSAPINISPAAATTIQLTTLDIVPNPLNLTALVTLTAQVSNPAGTVNEGLVTFTLAGMSVQGTVHNGTANAQVVIPLLSLVFPMNIPATYADNSLPTPFGPGNAVTPVVFNLLNALLPSIVTLTPGGGEQNVISSPFGPLVFSYLKLDTFFGAVVLETLNGVPVQAFFFGPQGQFLGVVP